MSIEALAMAGADYVKCAIDLQELEREDQEKTPLHLLAEQRPGNKSQDNEMDIVSFGKWQMRMKEEMASRAYAAATFDVFLLQVSGLERAKNLQYPLRQG